jgi:hypothetical protein
MTIPPLISIKLAAWVAAGMGAVIVTLSVLLWAAGVRIDDVKNQVVAEKNKVAAAQQTIKGQTALLAQCDAATKALDAEGRKRQAEAEKALATARSEAGRYQQEAKRLRGLQGVPTPSGADCRQALREIRRR